MLAFEWLCVVSVFAFVGATPHDGPRRHHTFDVLESHQNRTLGKRYDNVQFTMYTQTGSPGACGQTNSDSQYVSAHLGAIAVYIDVETCYRLSLSTTRLV